MAVHRIIGKHIISEEELRNNPSRIAEIMESQRPPALGGEIRTLGATTPYMPIGKGRPLTVLIRHVYTGQYPDPNFLGHGGDIAVVSGVRDFDVFNAQARALNFIQESVPPNSHLKAPSAFTNGTPLVAYSPAVLADSITLTIELAAARFPQGFVKSLSGGFSALAGIPMLMPYAGWLLGSGQITKLAGDIGHALMDGPVFTETEELDFEVPGATMAIADFRVISRPEFPAHLFNYKEGKGLVDLDDQAYRGEQPYVVVSLDGRKNDRYAKFAPTLASAAVLERFFQVKEGQQAAIDTLIEGMRLASDLKYRQLADGLAQEIDAAAGDAEMITSLTQQLKAVRDNIQTPALRPPLR